MEISSQYTVQVTMVQLPILAIFSFVYNQFLHVPITYKNSFMCVRAVPSEVTPTERTAHVSCSWPSLAQPG